MHDVRPARLTDIPALMEIRASVRENALVALRLSREDYVQALTVDGRGFVCDVDGQSVGFVCGRPSTGDIWALFVREAYQGRGIGSALLDIAESWMFEQGLAALTLTTAPGTRAERLYRLRGWQCEGPAGPAERAYRLQRPTTTGRPAR